MTTPFWLSNPTILFKQESITQIWPTPQMTSEEKRANQALLPTPMAVTDRADARSAPATGAADL